MVTLSFNHIQGKNGSHWNRLMREEKAKEYCIVAIDAAKFVNTAMVCTIYGDILQEPFEFDGSLNFGVPVQETTTNNSTNCIYIQKRHTF